MIAESVLAERLAQFAAGAAGFPPAAIGQAKRMLLDQMACQISGATLPWSRGFRDSTLALGGGGEATVTYFGDRLALDHAAFLNSAFGHANELDDTHLGSQTHPGSVIIPPAIAIGESRHLSGAAVLDAIVVGAEIMTRLGYATVPHLHERGFYTPRIAGPPGAAAASSRALGSDAETTLQAMAISGSYAGGTREFMRGGGSAKRIQLAIPAAAGLRSAVMAAHGITGPRGMLDGEFGLFAMYAGEYDLNRTLDGLGERFLIEGISFKPIACNLSIHAAVEAIAEIVREHRLQAEDVSTIRIGVSQPQAVDVGHVVEPHDILGAQSSLAWCSAVRLLRGGCGPNDFHEEDLRDPRFIALARTIEIYVDPLADEERRTLLNRGAIATIGSRDGRSFEWRVRFPKGSPQNPLTDEELHAKFIDAVAPVLGERRAVEIAERIESFEQAADAGELTKRCVHG